ncbi:DnaA regulatory inactivator Hda [Pandoraea sp.]|uniref:DnaA regulatory inactivator Hda n=1 Tax=Pandoraea sp. TaxID=1883445 RepID=UPI0011FF4089|nr:DnaA regulatory inactivator Hda [Pandoraea sp.]TAL56584.1 MAG: DnaA regulatory inactivator Hda [Pandoraea sp.]TAM15405.1 MAG: DnaA regulatory inactivator Hda [Pandoraea sp.]
MNQQLLLDLGTPPPATFDNFITGANREAVALLGGLPAALDGGFAADRGIYLWGEPGCGRTHLLHALCHASQAARLLTPHTPLAAFAFDESTRIYCVDDCDTLSPTQQIAAFNLFNEVRARPHCAFVASGRTPPLATPVREDLRTRLGWGLVFQLAALDDAGKTLALQTAARERGLVLSDDVPAYLLTHFRRDMPSLMALLDALDRFSLEQKRAVTLPLLRRMLIQAPGEGAAATHDAAPSGKIAPHE